MKLASRLPVAIASGLLFIAIPLALRAAPGEIDPSGPVLRPSHVPTVPSDTVTKVEKGKSDKGGSPVKKKSLKGRQAGPSGTSDPRQFLPDQPWETEFFVENDLTRQPTQRPLLVLASARQ